jgi:hypothetical protein
LEVAEHVGSSNISFAATRPRSNVSCDGCSLRERDHQLLTLSISKRIGKINCGQPRRRPANTNEIIVRKRHLSEIGGNQIVRTPASADIYPGRGSAYQITVRIEYFQKARLVGAGIRFNPPQCGFVDEE